MEFVERGKGEVLGETAWGFAIGSFVYNVVLLLLYILQGRVGHDGLQAKLEMSPRFHHEEGAPTLLFLIVASEHSASDESQSESPNCNGF